MNQSITLLDMSSNKIKEVGGIALAQAIKERNRSIKHLFLHDNYFNDNVGYSLVEAARNNPVLLKVKLQANPINSKYITEITKNLQLNKHRVKRNVVPNLHSQIGRLNLNESLVKTV
jgi:hypothetical protein